MNKRLFRAIAPGQSIPLIALLVVVLFAMVGLSVDVGNTYATQRATVRATDAAAISGMTAMIGKSSDAGIAQAIVNSLRSNKVDVADYANGVGQTSDNRTLTAQYLKADGNPLCYVGSCGNGNPPPSEASYIQVKVEGFTTTYFARVVGRDTLPVKAQSFVGKCNPTTGVYPIAIQLDYLAGDRFKVPNDPEEMAYYGIYKDEDYQGKYSRRIYEKQNGTTSGGFGYVRWLSTTSEGSATATRAMLYTDGNLDEGFEEAPWPAGVPGMPSGYPIRPGTLGANDSDWIYANTGVMNGVEPELEALIENRTRLILPIVDQSNGSGNGATLHVQGMGGFIMRGYGNEPGKGKYFDLVYVGDVSAIPCEVTNVITTTNLGLVGTVFVRPVKQLPPQITEPVRYTVVMDTSGSMNWNFYGEAKSGSNVLQCGASNDAARTAKRAQDFNACNAGNGAMWSPSTERRVAVAKNALITFINMLDPYDAMQIIGFAGRTGGVETTTSEWFYGTPAGKQALADAVMEAGKWNNDPYETEGGTPSATALKQARDLIANAPTVSTDGRNFRPVLLFTTDGVANYFVKNGNNGSGMGWYNDAKDNPSCRDNPGLAEAVECHVGYTNSTSPVARPITAMALQALEIRKTHTVYVIAMGGVPSTGLATEVASQSAFPFYSEATDASQMPDIFRAINQSTQEGTCVPAGGTTWFGKIDSAHTITNAADRSKFSLPADQAVYGYVYLKDAYGASVKPATPIKHDPVSGQLSFSIPDVTPGTYKIEAYVAYKGDDVPTQIARKYSWILFPNLSHDDSRTFNVAPSQTLNNSVALEPLYLDMNGNVCP
jgi:hypothetical protein